MTIAGRDVHEIARHPYGRFVVRLCESLARLPGVSHERADRLQDMLLSPAFRDITEKLAKVLPYVGKATALHSLAQAIKKHGPRSGRRSYQRTLREWLDEQE